MGRNLDSTMAGHVDDKVVLPVVLAQLTFRSETVYCHSGVGTLTWNGKTFLGVGTMGSVGAISEGVEVQATGTTVGLSGIDPTLKAECLTDIRLGAPAKLWVGFWNLAANAFWGQPYLFFNGQIDKPSFSIGADALDISLALESRMVNMGRASNRRYTAADQHLAYPDDTGFNWVELNNDIAENWGG